MLKRYLLLILLCICMIPYGVKAQCSDQRLAELNKIAGNIQVNYSYDVDENNEPVFSVYVTNITPDVHVVDMFGNEYTGSGKLVNPAAIKLYVVSNDPNCGGDLSTISINTPTFNYYSNLSECKNNANPLCDIWLDTAMYSEEEFKQKLKDSSTDYLEEEKIVNNGEIIDLNVVIYVGIAFALLLVLLFVYYRFYLRRKVG